MITVVCLYKGGDIQIAVHPDTCQFVKLRRTEHYITV